MQGPESTKKESSLSGGSSSPPAISIPKGGGAIRGIGEKFGSNPVTGTGSMSVPIYTSPGRSGFGPELSLSYDSSAGNGPFGFGWSLSLPSITRKTDKGLPKYQDRDESDTFILSGAEDLVQVLNKQGNGWVPEDVPDRTIGADTYHIQRYRPRIEGLFARIERWTNTRSNETRWRSISRDNVVTVYGRTADSRIEDPDAPQGSPRVFSWLICESYDDKGNAIYYEYESEDSEGIDLSQTNERNRTDNSRSANRYLKRIKYGNKTPVEHNSNLPREFREDLSERTDWLFEVVFDYEEGHYIEFSTDPDGRQFVDVHKDQTQNWRTRQDPFSSYRSGFEVRTYRLCRRVLMYHRFKIELGVEDYLVRSTGFKYKESPIASFIMNIAQSGYKLQDDGTYLKKSLPPLEFEYSEAAIQDTVEDVDEESINNLPVGLDGTTYQWTDLHGEGISGILTEQADTWFYKRNLSPVSEQRSAKFAPLERVTTKPNLSLSGGQAQLMDLAGDGRLDLIVLDGPMPGHYEHDGDEGWRSFRPFTSRLNRNMRDSNLKFVDLNGDGHADVLISENDAFVWHASLAEEGFGPAHRDHKALDEEKGPRLVFADGTQSIYLADLSGDGLTDLVRIRNGEVCYWPNLGYGRFGAKVTMDNSPHFDTPDHFDQRRIRLADIDGSGVTDIIYLKGDGVYIYLNESGNNWANVKKLTPFPQIDNLSSVMTVDLLGNGTACLVWSSPLPNDSQRPMRYVDLMGGQKPHLLTKVINNLGAETYIHYVSSTYFYIKDKEAKRPWITKIPFPVHVVERVETYDHISRNRFITRYAYHHGYFDGEEREFRGFGMVEQWDTEEFAALEADGLLDDATNLAQVSHVPPVLTRTWFHTGAYLGRSHISNFFAGLLDANDIGEYYREPAWRGDDTEAKKRLLDDTIMPDGLTLEEEREACRALKGSMLRQEVYALDGSEKEEHPYTVTEQNFTVKCMQARAGNRHAVFFSHAREVINYHYERNPSDPRISHSITLKADNFGNVERSLAIGYPRRDVQARQPEQSETHISFTVNRFINEADEQNWYRVGMPMETRTYELVKPPQVANDLPALLKFDDLLTLTESLFPIDQNTPPTDKIISYEEWDWRRSWDSEAEPGGPNVSKLRLIENLRTFYRKDDLTAFLELGKLESMALPGESYKLAFNPELAKEIYVDSGKVSQANLNTILADAGRYVHSNGDDNWWIPAGRVFYSPDTNDDAAAELAYARQHFFLPHRYRDPFHTDGTWNTETVIDYDRYDLLLQETRDALGNLVTVGERKQDGSLDKQGNNYRVLQPEIVMDPNRNRTRVAFDAFGMVVGTAVMGKPEDNPQQGDLLDSSFEEDIFDDEIDAFYDAKDPHVPAENHLKKATTRVIYDMDRFYKTRKANPNESEKWEPVFAATLARETHVSDRKEGKKTKIQISFSYSDGFGREIQKKIQAEPEKKNGVVGPPRWVGSGWTIFNNKGKVWQRGWGQSHPILRSGRTCGCHPASQSHL
jgi:hypothetical protein